jgi:glyceraldehyde 3-phosphate dehydrogenase
MPLRFGINGLGRIGRALLRIASTRPELELVAFNDIVAPAQLAPLVARDTVHGRFDRAVRAEADALWVDEVRIAVHQEPEPADIDWDRAGVEVVVEATGRFLQRRQAAAHLQGAVRTVVLSANSDPAGPADFTVCIGLNEARLDPTHHQVVSNASCTTNCLALVAHVLHEHGGLRHAMTGIVHSYTENQRLLDQAHADRRRSRAAALNMIPTPTTAPAALGAIDPALAGKIEGFAVRVPTPGVAMLDLVAELSQPAAAEAIRAAFREAASGPLGQVLGVTEEELVSSDFISDPRSAIVDLPLVQAVGPLARVVAWYDNEWGYATRLADLLGLLAAHARRSTGTVGGR